LRPARRVGSRIAKIVAAVKAEMNLCRRKALYAESRNQLPKARRRILPAKLMRALKDFQQLLREDELSRDTAWDKLTPWGKV
jgi:hypothetical protein